jgi:hypothetical protein
MGLWAWIILLAVSAALATAAQYLFFRYDRKTTDYDWVFIAGGALLGGFTATVWYPVGLVLAVFRGAKVRFPLCPGCAALTIGDHAEHILCNSLCLISDTFKINGYGCHRAEKA